MTERTDHDAIRRQIGARIAGFEARSLSDVGHKRAAVAIMIVATEAGHGGFVLTKRSPRLNTHSGQWALPGGRVDDGETVVEAALREVEEEVGFQAQPDAVLGRLDDYPTRSGYLITPVVLWAGPDAVLDPNPAEVASIHRIPFGELTRADSPEFVAIPESDRPVVRLPIGDSLIHAPTAAVLYQFREVCLHGRATRVDHLEQPVWAWK